MKNTLKLTLSFLLFIISLSEASTLGDSVQQKKILPPDIDSNYLFGSSTAMNNNYFVVGAPGDDINGINSGSAYVYSYQDSNIQFKQKLIPLDGASSDNFGYSMCINNNYLFIGAPGKSDAGINSGAVYVFNLADTLWTQKQKLSSLYPETNAFFGFSISISYEHLIIGEPFKKYNDTICGAVNLFVLNSGNWIYKSYTYPPDRKNNQRFGFAITNSNNYIFIGAPGDNTYGINSGAIYNYIFYTQWYFQFKHFSNLPAAGDEYGYSLDNGKDYMRLVVGAPGVDQNGIDAGKVYFYNTTGISIALIKSFQANDPSAGDKFGYSVSAEVDHNLFTKMIIGAAYKKTFNNLETGCSYLFSGDRYNVTQLFKIIPRNVSRLDKYGNSVALSGDYFIVGAPNNDEGGTNSGAIFFNKIVRLEIPVELTSFTASISKNTIYLTWSTASELNNYGFEIERQFNKEKWCAVGFKEGHGTTTEEHSYTFYDKNITYGKYFYRLKQIDFDGTFTYSNEIDVEVTPPLKFELEQNYPNPFNPSTKIKCSIPSAGSPLLGGARGGYVTLKVYDILGNEIATLVDEYKPAGTYEVEFQSTIGSHQLASGVYYYQLKTGELIQTKKMMLLR